MCDKLSLRFFSSKFTNLYWLKFWSFEVMILSDRNWRSMKKFSFLEESSSRLWINCATILADLNLFVVATSEQELIFYEINAHTYDGSILVNQFPSSVTAIEYRLKMKNSFESTLFCGDALGNLWVFRNRDSQRPMFHISDGNQTNKIRTFSFARIVKNEYATISLITYPSLHPESIVQIQWIERLERFVSLSLTSKNSLAIGDLSRKQIRFISSRKILTVFQFCKVKFLI